MGSLIPCEFAAKQVFNIHACANLSSSYWTRRFKAHMEKKRAGRMTAIPQLDVPDIFVDDEEERSKGAGQRSTMAVPPSSASARRPSDLLTTPDMARPLHKSWSSSVDISSSYDSTSAHPLSFPRANPSMPGHQPQGTSLNFEVQEAGSSIGRDNASTQSTNTSPAQVRGLLDDSVWVESIRRSATIRKSVRKTDWSAYR